MCTSGVIDRRADIERCIRVFDEIEDDRDKQFLITSHQPFGYKIPKEEYKMEKNLSFRLKREEADNITIANSDHNKTQYVLDTIEKLIRKQSEKGKSHLRIEITAFAHESTIDTIEQVLKNAGYSVVRSREIYDNHDDLTEIEWDKSCSYIQYTNCARFLITWLDDTVS